MDFTQSMDNGYMIPSSIAVGSGEATDIRCVCDTVEDFRTFLDSTGMELRYEGLVTYEKVNKLLKVYKGNNEWQVVGEGGGSVDTSNFVTLTQLSQQLGNYYTKTQTDSKISEEIAKAQIGGSGEVDLSAYATKNYVDDEISKIELKEGPQGPKGDKGEFDADTVFSSLSTEDKTVIGAINENVNKISILSNKLQDHLDNNQDNGGLSITRPIFSDANPHAKKPLNIITYEGGENQPMHPKVLYFENSWNGFKYWMAYTPLPNEDNENPCIAVSNDMINWTVPNGLENPLAFMPPTGGYNSDTHLVYRKDIDTLECWYRRIYTGIQKEEFFRRTTKNGVVWTEEESCFVSEGSITQNLSPSLIFEEGKYKMWTFANDPTFKYWESLDGKDWTKIKDITIAGGNWWHGDVIHTSNGYEMLLYVNSGGRLYYTRGYDNVNYTPPQLILEPTGNSNDWDSDNLYRSSFFIKDGYYYIFYSGRKMDTMEWKIGLTRGATVTELKGLEDSKNLTIEEAILDLYSLVGSNEGASGDTGGDTGGDSGGDTGGDNEGTGDGSDDDNVVSNGLVMHLDARDGNGTTWQDRTSNGNNFTLYNFKNTPDSGWNNKTLVFNGVDNYCRAVTPNKINGINGSGTKEITFCVNFTPMSLNGHQDIFDIKTTNSSRFLVLNNAVNFQMMSLITPSIPITFEVGKKYDCVFTYYYSDAVNPVVRRYNLWINGEKAYEFNDEAYAPYQLDYIDLFLGSEQGTSAFANMKLNSVKVYNRELADNEIVQNYEYENSINR